MPDNITTDDLIERREEIISEIEDAIHNTLCDIDTFKDMIDELYEIADIESYCSDFSYGANLIHEDNFVNYIEELISDAYHEVYDVVENCNWPVIKIDYEQSANDARMDFTEVEYLGDTYLVR